MSPDHVAQYHSTGSEIPPPYAPQSSRYGSQLPCVEDDIHLRSYAVLELHARNDDALMLLVRMVIDVYKILHQ